MVNATILHSASVTIENTDTTIEGTCCTGFEQGDFRYLRKYRYWCSGKIFILWASCVLVLWRGNKVRPERWPYFFRAPRTLLAACSLFRSHIGLDMIELRPKKRTQSFRCRENSSLPRSIRLDSLISKPSLSDFLGIYTFFLASHSVPSVNPAVTQHDHSPHSFPLLSLQNGIGPQTPRPEKKRDRAKRKISRHMGKQVKQMKWTIYFLLRRVRFMQHSFGVHIAATHVFELAFDIKTCDEAQLENPSHVDAETKKGNERQSIWMWPAIPADQHDCIYKVKAGKKSWDELGNQTCPTYREAS